jgi:hypothetical protein
MHVLRHGFDSHLVMGLGAWRRRRDNTSTIGDPYFASPDEVRITPEPDGGSFALGRSGSRAVLLRNGSVSTVVEDYGEGEIMERVTRIDWTVQTGQQWWSGTDTAVQIEIYRDGTLIKRLNLEPGNTPRLNIGERANYYWVFQDPDGIGVAVSGTVIPYTVAFPDGVAGHLRVKLIARGDDACEKVSIFSTVTTGNLRFVPGTIDASVWVEDYHSFLFSQDVVLSTDSSEGFREWTLRY